MADEGATVVPESQNPDDVCPRSSGITGGRHAFIWMAGDSNVVYCMNCGQKRKRTMTEDTVIEPAKAIGETVEKLLDSDIFTAPTTPAELTTPIALAEQLVQNTAASEALSRTIAEVPPPTPQEMTAVGGMQGYTDQPAADPPADPPPAAPAPSGGE